MDREASQATVHGVTESDTTERLHFHGESLLLHQGFLQFWRAGFPCCRAQALGHMGFSSCSMQAPECRLSSCGPWPQLSHSMWDLPRPGMQPVSSALQDRFLTTEPSGKPSLFFFLIFIWLYRSQLQHVESSVAAHIFSNCVTWAQMLCGMQNPSSPTRNQTRAPCIGNMESQPLDHQGSLYHFCYIVLIKLYRHTQERNQAALKGGDLQFVDLFQNHCKPLKC